MSEMATATIWDRYRLGVTLGAVALIFLAALESLAVTTVMPVVSAALDGEALFAVAFAGTLATSVIGMVAAGAWSDARGPRGALYAAVTLFLLGLVISGLATNMYVFLIGRLVQGLGTGGQTVALYVVVARLYPAQLHGRVFAAFAAAWVVPSMIGPFLAGAVAEFLHWRWAFLGVAVLTAIAFATVAIRLRGVDLGGGEGGMGRAVWQRLGLASVVAAGAVVVGFSADLDDLRLGWVIAAVAIVVIAVAVRPLLPPGTLRARPGLPSVVLLRGIVAAAFFAGEAYVPNLLMNRFAFTPTWAGISLMLAALAWAGASAVQGRYGDRLGNLRIALIGTALVAAALLAVPLTVLLGWSPLVIVLLWTCAGAGMGLLYPRLTVLTLAYSHERDQGFNSSALSISDSGGSAVFIAVVGLAFASLGGEGGAYVLAFGMCIGLLVVGLIPSGRLGHGAERV